MGAGTIGGHLPAHGLLALACAIACGLGAGACGKTEDFHETQEVRSQACVTCHKAAYDATQNPKHAGVFPETCNECHSTKSWVPAKSVSHDWYPLREKHAAVACTSCHQKGFRPGDTPKTCVGCHQKDYDAAKQPPHAGYAKECETCHTEVGWRPASFAHPWPLDGAHLTTSCFSCHAGDPPKFAGTPRDCAGCHLDDYQNAPFPQHDTFSKTCTDCHDTKAWKPFVHAWPLDGAHKSAPCTGCHSGNPPTYKGTPQACVSCHLTDYQTSPFPGHQTFAQTCADCHVTTGWKPAIGANHPTTAFPLTGPHAMPCLDCHNPNLGASTGGQNTDCVGCHSGQHSRAKMDEKHKEEGDYPLGAAPPNFCLDCHKNGRK